MSAKFEFMHQNNIEIIYVRRSERNDRNWLHFKHSHPFSELFYITGGKGFFLIGEKEIPVREKDLVYIASNAEHTELSDYHAPLEYFVVGLNGLDIKNDELISIPYSLIHDKNREFPFYFYKSFEEYSNSLDFSNQIIKNLISSLLLLIEREQKLKIITEISEIDRTATILVKHFIDINFRDEISLDLLADTFHMSKYYLSHQFKKDYNISPIKYWNQVRIENAKELLLSSNCSISEASIRLGYKSQSYFTQSFKKDVGKTPAKFRSENSDNIKKLTEN